MFNEYNLLLIDENFSLLKLKEKSKRIGINTFYSTEYFFFEITSFFLHVSSK
ncbi:hypothetical protein ES703_16452 [subsurface metagenome]